MEVLYSHSSLANSQRCVLHHTIAPALDWEHYSSHSYRVGTATAAAAAGLPDHLIKTLGRWRSSAWVHMHFARNSSQSNFSDFTGTVRYLFKQTNWGNSGGIATNTTQLQLAAVSLGSACLGSISHPGWHARLYKISPCTPPYCPKLTVPVVMCYIYSM